MRNHLQPFLSIVTLIGLVTGHTAIAQDGFHQFSNKNGQKIEAKIVSVTPDWKTMKIQRRDGQSFDMTVNVLSLDDQQIVKTWIKANPNSTKIDYNLDIAIEKKAKTTKNQRDEYYKYKTMEVSYEITVKNRTRQDLPGARVDYVVIMEDSVSVYRGSSGSYPLYDTDSGKMKYLRKSVKLPEALPFNYDHTILTEPLEQHQILADGNISYGEDKMLGVILRVVGANDEVLAESRSNESAIQRATWDQVKGNAFASNAAQPAGTAPETPMPSAPSVRSMINRLSELPEWLVPRELASWPELLQKGDVILTPNMPRWGQKPVRILAHVDIDESNTGGVIVACGGQSKGFTLFVLNDSLQFWSRKALENNQSETEGIGVPLSELPDGEFKVYAEYTRDALKIWINDSLVAEGPSVGLIQARPNEGLSVGFDSENGSVGPAPAPHPFLGSIRDVQVKFGAGSIE